MGTGKSFGRFISRKLTLAIASAVIALLNQSAWAAFSAQLQAQSFGSTTWSSANALGWAELDYIPTRVYVTGGPATARTITVSFDHTKTVGSTVKPGVQNLTSFVASPNVTINSGPTLIAPAGADVWSYTFTIDLTDSNPGFVEFRTRLSAGAHLFTGSSLNLGGSPSLGNLAIGKPAQVSGSPDLVITKVGATNVNAGATITYSLSYQNSLAGTAATGVQITDILPTAVRFLSCSGGCSVLGNSITWDLGNLPRGASGALSYQVAVTNLISNGITFQNNAFIASAENDANPADNSSFVVTTVTSNCVPPQIITAPLGTSVCEGSAVNFSVAANGSAPLHFQWRKDGIDLPGQTNTSYSIAAASPSDSGSYTVIISNLCSAVTSSAAILNVSSPFTCSITGVDTVCPQAAGLTYSAPAGAMYSWSILGNGAIVGESTNNTVTVNATGAGSFTLALTMGSGSCATSCQKTVIVADMQNPVISLCAEDQTLEAGANCEMAVPDFTLTVQASDTCSAVTITQVPAAGSMVGVGAHPVTITVMDASGNSAQCSATFTVKDSTAPMISCPPEVSVDTDADSCVATGVILGSPTFSDSCGIASIVNDAPAQYPAGMTVVTWTVTDLNGNSSFCQQLVTVADHQPPTISCPNPMTVSADPGQCFTSSIDLGSPTVSDNCAVDSASNDAPAQFPVGTTMVMWTVTDIHGNASTCAQSVTVEDNEAPTIACPADVTVDAAPGATSVANVALGDPVVADNCGIASTSNDAPATFLIGHTTVTWTVTDIHGHTATCQQTVTVNSVNTAPTAGNDTYQVAEDDILTVSAPGVLANDHDMEGATLSAIVVTGPAHGALMLNSDGSFTYEPVSNFSGTDSFTYKANDGSLHSNIATVTIHVLAISGAGDIDLYVQTAGARVDWASHARGLIKDRLMLRGQINPRGMRTNLTGATMSVSINGHEIMASQPLDALGKAMVTSGSMKMKCQLRASTGAYRLQLSGVDLRDALGLINATGSGMSVMTVTLSIDGADLQVPVMTADLECPYASKENSSSMSRFSFRKNRTLSGVFNANKTMARLSASGTKLQTRGAMVAEGAEPIIPNDNITIHIGDATLVVPIGMMSGTGTTPATTLWQYTGGKTGVPGLTKFSFSNMTHAFTLAVSSATDMGFPALGLSHNLPVMIEVPTASGSMFFESTIELKRTVETSSSWKR